MNAQLEQFITPAYPGSSSWFVPGRTPDPIASAKRHRKLAAVIIIAVAILGLAAALMFGHAQYVSTASVRILPTYDTRLATGIDSSVIPNIDYRSFVQQQVFEIANPETIKEALKLLGPKASLWQLPDESQQHAAERLLGVLKVEWLPDTFLINVSLKGSSPQGLAEIVHAVITAYLDRQQKQDLSGADTRVSLLNQRKSTLVQEANAERAQLGQLSQELGVSTFDSGLNDPYDRMLANATEALDRERRNLILQQSRLAALQAQQEEPPNADLNSLAEKMLLDNPDLAAQKSELEKQREATFLQLEGLAPSHPGRPALEQEIAYIDQEISHIDNKAVEQARSVLVGTRAAEWRDKIIDAQTRVDQAQLASDGIEKEVATLKASGAVFGTKYNQALALHEQLQTHTKEITEIDDRIDLMRLDSQSPGVASVELPAQVPDQPEGGKRKVILGLSIFLAVLLGLGLPTVIDLADPRVKSSRELETILQMPVLGSNLKRALLPPRETLRRIALAILRERRQSGTRVFVITGVEGKAGTSSLTLALANELTELGAATVAVEANASSPDVRYQRRLGRDSNSLLGSGHNGTANGQLHSNAKNTGGSSELTLVHRNSLEPCIHTITQASDVLPDRVSICQRQKHQRLAMTCLREVLDIALASHDLVLMDAPPILASADTTMLVQNPAGVILVVRAERDLVEDVVTAAQELSKLSPPVVGIVLQGEQMGASLVAPGRQASPEEGEVTISQSSPSSFPSVATKTITQYS